MPFKKGSSGNKKGRQKGTPNKTTQLQRDFIQSLLDSQLNKMKVELSGLHGKSYFAAINGLMEFVMPKLQRSEYREMNGNDIPILLGYGPEVEHSKFIIKYPQNLDFNLPSNSESEKSKDFLQTSETAQVFRAEIKQEEK